jgi:hypothetical protein
MEEDIKEEEGEKKVHEEETEKHGRLKGERRTRKRGRNGKKHRGG